MTSTTTTPQMALYGAVRDAIDDRQFSLKETAVLLRYQQLTANVLHPHDSCGWSAGGSDPAMEALGQVLQEQGLLEDVDRRARRLLAQVCLARVTLSEIHRADSEWGSAIATLEDFTDGLKRGSSNG